MLALQAAITHGAHSLDSLLFALAVLAALFWKATLKIILFLLIFATVATIMLAAAAVLPMLGHMIR
jgi:hypothetical protein